MSTVKYERPMFQEFIKCLFDNSLFPMWVYVNALFFKMNCYFFSKALLDSSVSCHSYAKI